MLGYVAEQTPENSVRVTQGVIENFLIAGYTAGDIFLIWNSGQSKYCSSGYNKHGVWYDSCAYVEKAKAVLFEKYGF